MTTDKLELAVAEMRELLDKLAAQSMESARRVQEIREQLTALTGDLETQWEKLQALRSEIAAQLSSDSPKTPQ
jgi:uncharacterized coiled-coil DUF342 family protein